jgi:hypothetical protein
MGALMIFFLLLKFKKLQKGSAEQNFFVLVGEKIKNKIKIQIWRLNVLKIF